MLEALPNTGRLPLEIAATTFCGSQKAARSAGAPRFFTGRPCKAGHLSDRFTVNRVCCECVAHSKKLYDMPVCLTKTPQGCFKCDRFPACPGVGVDRPVIRAQLAFPDHEGIPRAEAIKNDATVFKWGTCKHCGGNTWRHVISYKCGSCGQ